MFYTYIVFSSDHSSYFLWVGLQYAQWAPAVKKRQIVVHAQSLILCALTINSITNITSHVMVSYFSRLKLDRFQSFLLLFFFCVPRVHISHWCWEVRRNQRLLLVRIRYYFGGGVLSRAPQSKTMCRTLQARLKPLKPQPAVPTMSYGEKQSASR